MLGRGPISDTIDAVAQEFADQINKHGPDSSKLSFNMALIKQDIDCANIVRSYVLFRLAAANPDLHITTEEIDDKRSDCEEDLSFLLLGDREGGDKEEEAAEKTAAHILQEIDDILKQNGVKLSKPKKEIE